MQRGRPAALASRVRGARPRSPRKLRSLVVPIESVTLHPNNARRGNVDAVAASLARFGQQKPIVVQASTRYVVAGKAAFRFTGRPLVLLVLAKSLSSSSAPLGGNLLAPRAAELTDWSGSATQRTQALVLCFRAGHSRPARRTSDCERPIGPM